MHDIPLKVKRRNRKLERLLYTRDLTQLEKMLCLQDTFIHNTPYLFYPHEKSYINTITPFLWHNCCDILFFLIIKYSHGVRKIVDALLVVFATKNEIFILFSLQY